MNAPLEPAERTRFALWLEEDARVDDGLIEQMKKVGVPTTFIHHRQRDADAKRRVATLLRSAEDYSLGVER
jgi:hypothetical protein